MCASCAQIALRLAQLFGLTLSGLQQWSVQQQHQHHHHTSQPGDIIDCIQSCRELGKPGLTSAVGLLRHFQVSMETGK